MAVACLKMFGSLRRNAKNGYARVVVVLIALVVVLTPGVLLAVEKHQYVLGPQDEIVILAVEPQEIANKPVRISSDGMVSLPLVGPVKAAGLTVEQFEAELQKRLRPFVNDPQVSVNVTEIRSRRVSVLGAVNKPGIYQLYGSRTLIEMLSEAGGLRQDAGSKINITRKRGEAQDGIGGTDQAQMLQVQLRETTDLSLPDSNPEILPDDVILVTRADTVYVVGDVNKPGGYVLNDRESLSVLKALSLAGGVQRTAAPGSARLIRAAGGSSARTEVEVDLKRILQGKSPDVNMRAEDILFVPQSAGKRVAIRSMEAIMQMAVGMAIYRH